MRTLPSDPNLSRLALHAPHRACRVLRPRQYRDIRALTLVLVPLLPPPDPPSLFCRGPFSLLSLFLIVPHERSVDSLLPSAPGPDVPLSTLPPSLPLSSCLSALPPPPLVLFAAVPGFLVYFVSLRTPETTRRSTPRPSPNSYTKSSHPSRVQV